MLGVVASIALIQFHKGNQALGKLLVIFLFRLRPLYFGQGCHTGQNHIFHLLGRWNVFSPKIGLCTQDVFGLFFVQFGSRFKAVHFFYRQVSADGIRFILGLISLIVVKVAECVGGHHYVVAHLGGFDTSCTASPRHDCSVGGNVSFQNFIPADDLASLFVEVLLYACHTVALQTVFSRMFFVGFKSFSLDAGLALWTFLPTGTG